MLEEKRAHPDTSTELARERTREAADHFDDGPLAFWDLYGRRTVGRLDLKHGSSMLDVGYGTGTSALSWLALTKPS